METDFSTALKNAALFLDKAGETVHDSDSATLAAIGNGWAALALALSQDKQVHAVAEAAARWLHSPEKEGFTAMLGAIAAWTGAEPQVQVLMPEQLEEPQG